MSAIQVFSTGKTAIVGAACRVAGANTPSKLWQNIIDKRDLCQEIPKDRFNVDGIYHPNGKHKGTTNVNYGYFIDQPIDHFDPTFFNISGKEAEAMDPQQRLILEIVYEALEDAGIPLDEISGTKTSVYAGSFTNDYALMTARDMDFYPRYAVNGTSNAILANRVSFFFNLRGPSIMVDTACSASLVGFHLGNESLLHGESDYSIVIGSALHFIPNTWQIMTDMGLLSADGRCRAFDASGKGYGRGEGVCAVVLKRLADAEQNIGTIRAVVCATGTNHDGTKSAIGLPSAQSQERLLRETYAKAGLSPDDTQFFEAHGTGTPSGDPREAKAIAAVFATPTRQGPLYLGSVKTNIGHLEGAAGLAGIIKAVLAIEHATIPPNMLFTTPNPEIPFEQWRLGVPTAQRPWTVTDNSPRRASVNSFGYGGANAHVILEEYQSRIVIVSPDVREASLSMTNGNKSHNSELSRYANHRPYILQLSSHSETAANLATASLVEWASSRPHLRVADLAYSLALRRSIHKFRAYIVGSTLDEVARTLSDSIKPVEWTASNPVQRIGFIFTGQGAHSYSMGRQLIEISELFRLSLERADAAIRILPNGPSWAIVEELMRSESDSKLDQSEYSQPICTAVQLALVDLLGTWGIKPIATCGHSSGEIAAAYAAGLLSFDSAMAVAYYRGYYMGRGVVQRGAMMAVGMGESEIEVELRPYHGELAVAAINSPRSVTVSGDEDSITNLHEMLAEKEIFTRRLRVQHAFHSHHMRVPAEFYLRALSGHVSRDTAPPEAIPMFSSVTGHKVTSHEQLDASYWAENMTRLVRYSDALTALLEDEASRHKIDVLLEIGPQAALRGPSRQIMASMGTEVPYFATLDRGRPALETLLDTVGQLFSRGYPVDMLSVNQDEPPNSPPAVRLRDLPPYAWDHQSFWSTTRLIEEHLHRPPRHTILGTEVPGSVASTPRWRNFLRLSEMPWLREHVFEGKVLFPGAAYVSMAIEAVIRVDAAIDRSLIRAIELKEVYIKAPMILSDSEVGAEVYVELRPVRTSSRTASDEWLEFAISSYNEAQRHTEHCTGLISLVPGTPQSLKDHKPRRTQVDLVQKATRRVKSRVMYNQIHESGLLLGPRFKLIEGNVFCGPDYVIAPSVVFQPQLYSTHELSEGTLLWPTILDTCFQSAFHGIETQLGHRLETVFVPTFIKSIQLSGFFETLDKSKSTSFGLTNYVSMPNSRTAACDVYIARGSDTSSVMLAVEGLEMTAMGTADKTSGRKLFFKQTWFYCFDYITDGAIRDEALDVADALHLYQLQHPGAKVLLLLSQASPFLTVLSKITHLFETTQGFQSLRVAEETLQAEHRGEINGLVSQFGDRVSVGAWESGYDLVVSPDSTIEWEKLEASAKASQVIITSPLSTTSLKWTRQFCSTQCAAFRRRLPKPDLRSNITVIKASGILSSVENTILQEISSSPGHNVTEYTFANIPGELGSGQTFLVTMLDLRLDYLSAQEWNGLRRLLSTAKVKMLWLLSGASMGGLLADQAQIMGLLRVARNENPNSRIVSFDLDPFTDPIKTSAELIFRALEFDTDDEDFAERDGLIFIPRILEDDTLNNKLPNQEPRPKMYDSETAVSLTIGTVGLLETLHFTPDKNAEPDIGPDDVEIQVKASALNFRDIAATMGLIRDKNLGDECSGIVHRVGFNVRRSQFAPGDRVVACRPGQGAHGTYVLQPASLCVKMPSSMSFTTAASFSGVLTTAYYALVDVARLQKGETVLIHAATGGVGQMAIQIAQRRGATILATCSDAKREFLKQQFGILSNHIFSSRDDSFVHGVMDLTDGRGVDVILNSLAGKLLIASWGCIASLGRFVEIGKRDIHQNAMLPMEPLRRSAMFASVDLVRIYEEHPRLAQRIFTDCAEMFFSGEVKPVEPILEFSYSQVEKAFRLLQQGKHTGKVVLVPHSDDKVPMATKCFSEKLLLYANKVYLVVGGLGGLGTVLVEWMVRCGARRIALLSRSCGTTPETKETAAWLRSKGVSVAIFRRDISVISDVELCIRKVERDLGGIFFTAAVLNDGLLANMTYDQWRACTAVKCTGALNLHEVTKTRGVDMDFFICFSSASAITGNKGQANYSAANAYLDTLMQCRRDEGHSGFSINIGAVTGAGIVEENAHILQSIQRMGHDTINEHELLYQVQEAVERSLALRKLSRSGQGDELARISDRETHHPHQIITGINVSEPGVFWAQRSLFRTLYANRKYMSGATATGAEESLATQLRREKCVETRIGVLQDAFLDKVSKVLGLSRPNMNPSHSLSSYGLDSIVAVELQKWLQDAAEVDVALFDLTESGSIQDLMAEAVAKRGD